MTTPPEQRPSEDPNRSFARFLLTDLLTDEERAHARRLGAAAWLLGAGLALLALALPTERLLGRGPEMVSLLAERGPLSPGLFLRYGLSAPLVGFSARWFGLSLEACAYLWSALSYGLCVPAFWHLARAISAPAGAALAIAALLGLSPLAWLGGSLPGPECALALGATLALLVNLRQPPRELGQRVPIIALAVLLHPVNALIAAGPLLAGHKTMRWLPTVAFYLAIMGFYYWDFWDFGQPLHPGQLAWKLGPITVYLFLLTGCALPLIMALRHDPQQAEESAPPKWLQILIIVSLLATQQMWDLGFIFLPMLAIGAAYGYEARKGAKAVTIGPVRLALQLLLAVGVVIFVARSDPDRAWRERVVTALEPADGVSTPSARHAYLLRQRWGLGEEPRANGRRLLEVESEAGTWELKERP